MMRRPCVGKYLLLIWALGVWAGPAMAAEKKDPCPPLTDKMIHQALYDCVQRQDKKDMAGAEKILKDFVKKYPDRNHHQLSYMLGVLAYLGHRPEEADAHFSRAVQLCPQFVPALRNLAVVRYERKRPLEAARLMLRAYEAGQAKEPDLLYQAAVMFLQGRKPDQALPLLQKLAGEAKPKVDWLRALVQVHRDLKQPKEAAQVLERVLAMKPEDANLWRLSAALLVEERKYDRAAAAMEVALRLKPPAQPEGWRELAELLRASRVPQRAAIFYRRSFGPNPTAKQWEQLARVYMEANRFKPALEAVEKAIKLEPTQSRLYMAGRILLNTGNYKASLAFLERAAQAPGKEAVNCLLLAGYCAWQLDSLSRAEKAYGQALAQAPKKGSQARQAAQALESVRRLRAWRAAQSSQETPGQKPLGG